MFTILIILFTIITAFAYSCMATVIAMYYDKRKARKLAIRKEEALAKLATVLSGYNLRQYINIINSGYSQVERDIVDEILAIK